MPTNRKYWNWKGDLASATTKRQRAVRMFKLDNCERCGEKATDRHHINGDTGLNTRENLLFLCRRCHMEIDGRLQALPSRYTPQKTPMRDCVNCGSTVKITRHGMCSACNEYKRRTGNDRPNFIPCAHVSVEQANTVAKLRDEGLSFRAIARKEGLNQHTAKIAHDYIKACHKAAHDNGEL